MANNIYHKALVWSMPHDVYHRGRVVIKAGQIQITYLIQSAMATDVRDDGVWDTDAKFGMPAQLIYPDRKTPETEAEFIKRAAEGGASVGALKPDTPAIPLGTPYQVVDLADIKQFNSGCYKFRDAYKVVDGALSVDMPQARQIHMGRIRRARNGEFCRLDVEYIKADEDGNAVLKSEIATKKRRLRNLPQTFDLSTVETPTELKDTWPEDLPPR